MAKIGTNCFRVPGLTAVIMGFGALVAGNATARISESSRSATQPEPTAGQDVVDKNVSIRTEGEKIFLSEDGGDFRELHLGRTSAALHLRKLLNQSDRAEGPLSVPVGSFIVANGGGRGDSPAASGTSAHKNSSAKKSRKNYSNR
jgi:hypothetical protein